MGEAVYFYKCIEKIEKRNQLDLIDKYLMQIGIIMQPHLKKENQGKLSKQLLRVKDSIQPPAPKSEEEIEKGLERLKQLL